MQIIDWPLKAGVYSPLTFSGRFFRLLTCSGSVIIDVDYESPESDRITTKVFEGIGVDLSHPISHARFKTVAFTSPIDQIVQILVSEFPSIDSRLSGLVSVNDDLYKSSANGGGFFVNVVCGGFLGSQWPVCEIQNQSATQNLVIDKITYQPWSGPGVGSMAHFRAGVLTAAALSADAGAPREKTISSKVVGGAVPAGLVCWINLLAAAPNLASFSTSVFYDEYVQDSYPQRVVKDFKRPIVVNPGGRIDFTWSFPGDMVAMCIEGRMI